MLPPFRMNRDVIPTKKHLEYAGEFIALGMPDDASDELDLIPHKDQDSDAVGLLRFEISLLRGGDTVHETEILKMWREFSEMEQLPR